MITYAANYSAPSRPTLVKIFTATSGEEFIVSFNAYTGAEELDYIDEPVISSHMDNLILYTEYMSGQMTYASFDANSIPNGNPIIGSDEIQWALNQLSGFWSYMRYQRFSSLDEEI